MSYAHLVLALVAAAAAWTLATRDEGFTPPPPVHVRPTAPPPTVPPPTPRPL